MVISTTLEKCLVKMDHLPKYSFKKYQNISLKTIPLDAGQGVLTCSTLTKCIPNKEKQKTNSNLRASSLELGYSSLELGYPV